jgi:hypothetical protein
MGWMFRLDEVHPKYILIQFLIYDLMLRNGQNYALHCAILEGIVAIQ